MASAEALLAVSAVDGGGYESRAKYSWHKPLLSAWHSGRAPYKCEYGIIPIRYPIRLAVGFS